MFDDLAFVLAMFAHRLGVLLLVVVLCRPSPRLSVLHVLALALRKEYELDGAFVHVEHAGQRPDTGAVVVVPPFDHLPLTRQELCAAVQERVANFPCVYFGWHVRFDLSGAPSRMEVAAARSPVGVAHSSMSGSASSSP